MIYDEEVNEVYYILVQFTGDVIYDVIFDDVILYDVILMTSS